MIPERDDWGQDEHPELKTLTGEDEHTAVVYSIFMMENAYISIYAEHANIIPEGRKPNRVEEFMRKRRAGEILGQKMKITVRYMKEKRRKRWEREYA